MADSNGNGSGPSELQRFEVLMKKLLAVPKAEIDKQRGKAKKRPTRAA